MIIFKVKNKLIINFMRRVVVTGMGLLTSIGNNKEKTWKNLINTKS